MNPYQVLEIPEESDQETIRRAFYKLSRIWHPDKNKNGDEQFRKIVQAYKILSENPEPVFSVNKSHWASNITLQVIEEMFKDIESMIKTPTKYLEFSVKPREIYNGTKREVTVTVCTICLTCQGTCLSKNCRACSRSGTVMVEKKFVIDVKKGTLAGQSVTFIGEGDELPGMLPGDVKFKIVIIDDDNWSIDNRNQLKKTVNIDLGNCFWKPEIYVQTLDTHDKYLRVTSRKGMKAPVLSGDRFYVDSRSKPCYSEKNDGKLFLNFKVQFPKTINAELRENLKRLPSFEREFKNTQKINYGNQKNALKGKAAVLWNNLPCLPVWKSRNYDSDNLEESDTVDRKENPTITKEFQVPKGEYDKTKYEEMKEERVSQRDLLEEMNEIDNKEQEEVSVLQREQKEEIRKIINRNQTELTDMKNNHQNEIKEVKNTHEKEMELRQDLTIELESFEIIEPKRQNETESDGLKDEEHKNTVKIITDLLTISYERELDQILKKHLAQLSELEMKHDMEKFKMIAEHEMKLNKTITSNKKEIIKIIKSRALTEEITEQYPSKQDQHDTYDSSKMDTYEMLENVEDWDIPIQLENLEEGDLVINFKKQLANNKIKILDYEYNKW